jgi:hypothetical protein
MPEAITNLVDPEVYHLFRETIFFKSGLKRGDIRRGIEESMLLFIEKYRPEKLDQIQKIRAKIGIKETGKQ